MQKHKCTLGHIHTCKLTTYIIQHTHNHMHTSMYKCLRTAKDYSTARYTADKHTCGSTCTHSTKWTQCTSGMQLTKRISKLSSSSRLAWCTLLSNTPNSAGVRYNRRWHTGLDIGPSMMSWHQLSPVQSGTKQYTVLPVETLVKITE